MSDEILYEDIDIFLMLSTSASKLGVFAARLLDKCACESMERRLVQ